VRRTTLIGSASVSLERAFATGRDDQLVQLVHKGKPAGALAIILTLEGAAGGRGSWKLEGAPQATALQPPLPPQSAVLPAAVQQPFAAFGGGSPALPYGGFAQPQAPPMPLPPPMPPLQPRLMQPTPMTQQAPPMPLQHPPPRQLQPPLQPPPMPLQAPPRAIVQQSPLHSTVSTSLPGLSLDAPRVLMTLIDASTSMTLPCSATADAWPRSVFAYESLLCYSRLVEARQAGMTAAAGVRTFANELDLGYLSCAIAPSLWTSISWQGAHALAPAWSSLFSTFSRECGFEALLHVCIITDAAPVDLQNLGDLLVQRDNAYILVALFGHGTEIAAAYSSWMSIAAACPRVKVISFEGEVDPLAVGNTLSHHMLA